MRGKYLSYEKEIKKREALGVYVHIPFCLSKCPYCDFYSLTNAKELHGSYVGALLAHIDESAPLCSGHTADTIYFGGGTPTVIGSKSLREILHRLKKRLDVTKSAEITLETNPASATIRELRSLRRAGFNRLSVGVQSASDDELRALGRAHTFAQAEQTVKDAAKAGFKNISVDLIYGIPGQTQQSWESTLERAVSLNPQHISCYGMKIEEGTPFLERRSSLCLPDDDAQADMYLYACGYLAREGYAQYEISNFARPGFESRHNLKYWKCKEYIGFGPGAHSYIGGRRYSFKRDAGAYIAAVTTRSGFIVEDMTDIEQNERIGEYIMLHLRLTEGIDGAEFSRRLRVDFGIFAGVLEKYRQTGHARYEDGCWSLTPEGFLISNHILAELLETAERTLASAVK